MRAALPSLLLLLSVVLVLPAAPGTAAADEAGVVEGMQMPAWIVRGGNRAPLRPGARVHGGDRVETGPRARVLLRLAEGSHVKLGENARFEVRGFEKPEEPDGRFGGFLEVLRGAFRFTTTLVSQRHGREIDVRISGVTAGIRGTDVWGKAAPDRDIVCLIEGNVTVRRGDDPLVTMDEPLTFYVAPKGEPALPVEPVDPEQLREWARETELVTGEGVLRGGEWLVSVKSFRDAGDAERARETLHEAGFAAEVRPARVGGATWHRLVVPGFASLAEARAFAQGIEGRFGIRGAWVVR